MLSHGIRLFHSEDFVDETLLPDMRRALVWASQAAYAPRQRLELDEKKRPQFYEKRKPQF
jgi:hypothetical protein